MISNGDKEDIGYYMAKAKKLPSGQWRVLVYSHTETTIKNGVIQKQRRYKSITASSKKEAEYLAAEYAMSRHSASKPCNLTLYEAMGKYIDHKHNVLSPSTVRGYLWILNHIYQDIMPCPISTLTDDMIQLEVNRDAAQRSPKSVRNAYGLLTATLRMFRSDYHPQITLPQKIRPNVYVPTDADIKKLIDCVKGTSFELPVLLAAFGSLRRSEICALDASDIHENSIRIHLAMVKDEHGKWVIKPPKTDASYRNVELPQFVIEKMRGIEGRIVQLSPDYITTKFAQILKRNGIPHFKFHALRHYQASILHALGVPDKYIMARGGWSSASTLQNIYQHTMRDKSDQFTQTAIQHFEDLARECNTKCNTENKKPDNNQVFYGAVDGT